DRFALQLREPFVPGAQPLTPVDMAPRTLKTLTLIAYHQPILQSRLVRMMGETAYDEVQKLRDASFVHAEPKGATVELTTTHRFAEQFGIASTRPEEIRRFLERKLGVETPAGPAPDTPPSAEGPVSPPSVEQPETTPTIG
ncbi:MAG: SMC-Scp complex subunit ScpB, partial [Thermoplasmata archaeon]|nr:SMC-Scp complex subunit ScpB [Thermoplasmata archaeon]